MAEPGRESDHAMEAVQEVESIHYDVGDGDHEHSVLRQPDTAFLYELNLITVLLPFFSTSSTEDYFSFGEGEKSIEQIQAKASCGSRAKTRRSETNEFKFAGRKASKIHAIKDFRHSRKM